MTPEEQRTLDLFEVGEARPDINQRQLAEELCISLGLANAFLKTILNKGWIRARKVKARRWLYFLTPQGSLEKSRLTLNFLQRTLKSFREIRNQADGLLADLTVHGVHGIHLIGEEDFIDIIGLCLEHHHIQCLSKIIKPRMDSEENNKKLNPQDFALWKKAKDDEPYFIRRGVEVGQDGILSVPRWLKMN